MNTRRIDKILDSRPTSDGDGVKIRRTLGLHRHDPAPFLLIDETRAAQAPAHMGACPPHPHRGIDGMCLDTDGNIVATAGWGVSGPGPMIYVFAPNGDILEMHPLPADQAVDDRTLAHVGPADHGQLEVVGAGRRPVAGGVEAADHGLNQAADAPVVGA